MKRSVIDYLRIAQFPVIIAFGTLPLPMVMMGYLAPGLLGYAWTLPVGYLLLTLLSFFLPGKLRIAYGIVAGAVLIFPWVFTTMGQPLIVALLIAFGYACLLFWSTRIGGWSSDKELHSAWLGVCIALQLFGQFLFYFDSVSEVPALQTVSGWFAVSFFVMAVLVLMTMNRHGLNTIAAKRPKTAVIIRRKNVLLVLALFGLAAVFSLVPSAAGILFVLFGWVSDAIALIFGGNSDEIPIETMPSGGGSLKPPDFGIELNVGLHTDILNAIFMIVAVVVLVVIVPLLLYFVCRNFWRSAKSFWNKLIADVMNNMDDYDDEVTDTRESLIEERAEATRTVRPGLFYNDRGMGAQERIRYRYKYLLGRHPEWQKGSTARENLPAETAAIYERARYSPHPVTSEDADRFKVNTKKL